MGEAALGTGHVSEEIRLALRCWADRLDAAHENALVCEPVHRFQGKAREIVPIARPAEQPIIGAMSIRTVIACFSGTCDRSRQIASV